MKHEEAVKYVTKLYPAVTDEEMQLFSLLFEKVGALPIQVRQYVKQALVAGRSVPDILEEAVDLAHMDLVNSPHLHPILEKLKVSPNGVHLRAFQGVQVTIDYRDVLLSEPQQFALEMKKEKKRRNIIVYHIPSREYQLATRAHRTALQERYLKGVTGLISTINNISKGIDPFTANKATIVVLFVTWLLCVIR